MLAQIELTKDDGIRINLRAKWYKRKILSDKEGKARRNNDERLKGGVKRIYNEVRSAGDEKISEGERVGR